ncbi:MAG: Rrf2 family transcriptional regulator [Hydrogenophaga sp.]|uniref:RrF2 family transcriptional regulator n=1 Tax=Hydrogenophaga sp. TaxID=1904254 RepID=UPI0025BA5563|nr:Rrf2 family transcriptional regulator [Hydrogenophaga sp.]MBT9554240.1 Rrf2 family transcriptional regulator [Hydrogenophaga sp.]
MRLTHWSDYSLRVLMYCAACAQRDKPATISEIAEAHGISRSHLTKIVMTLSGMGLLETTRGRGGGLRLLKPARQIVLGEVIRLTETDFTLVECFDSEHNTCRLDGHCRLKGTLRQAMDSYLAVLDGVTLADLLEPMSPPGAGARKVVRVVKHIPGLPDA